MKLIAGALLTLVLLAAAGLVLVYGGVYNVAASDDHEGIVRWLTHTTMHNSVEARAEDITPPDLSAEPMIARGARAYDAMCAGCHQAPGQSGAPLREGMRPSPPPLAEGGHWQPKELFWIVKHGIKMSGMPAWGVNHDDEELWDVVAFLQRLPQLNAEQYQALVATEDGEAAGDHGH